MIHREHILQRQLSLFVRAAVSAEHEFLAFDRGAASGGFTHLRERGRGVRKGTPDTLLLVQGCKPIWCELKAPGNKPDEAQDEMGRRLARVGGWWEWCDTVDKYRRYLSRIGVPLAANAEFLAMHHDGQVTSIIARAEEKAGKPRKVSRAKERVTPAKIRKAEALRGRIRF